MDSGLNGFGGFEVKLTRFRASATHSDEEVANVEAFSGLGIHGSDLNALYFPLEGCKPSGITNG